MPRFFEPIVKRRCSSTFMRSAALCHLSKANVTWPGCKGEPSSANPIAKCTTQTEFGKTADCFILPNSIFLFYFPHGRQHRRTGPHRYGPAYQRSRYRAQRFDEPLRRTAISLSFSDVAK